MYVAKLKIKCDGCTKIELWTIFKWLIFSQDSIAKNVSQVKKNKKK